MASPITFTILLCLGTFAAALPGRIVGGEETTIEEYPSIVQVEFQGIFSGTWGQSCAASILTTRWCVSAAHCFDGVLFAPQYRRIRAGSTYRNTGGVVHNVARAINHPSYGSLQYDGDISVFELETALVYTPVVQPVTIVASGFSPPSDLPVVHAGWGTTSSGGSTSNVLRDVTIYTVEHEICAERYGGGVPSYVVTENMICAGILDVGGKDACQGDSGGPLYYTDILVGVVSWGRGCADSYYPGVSAAVSPYSDWIVETVQS